MRRWVAREPKQGTKKRPPQRKGMSFHESDIPSQSDSARNSTNGLLQEVKHNFYKICLEEFTNLAESDWLKI